MALSNRDRVGKALDLLREGLIPFVERELLGRLGKDWIATVNQGLGHPLVKDKAGRIGWDNQALVSVLWDQWNTVFKHVLGEAERTLVKELRGVRNDWAHERPFSSNDAHRAIDSMERLLKAVSAEQAREVEKLRIELLRTMFAEQARQQTRGQGVTSVQGEPVAGLKPWREIVTPHPDVAAGRFIQAEFAADLSQVYRGEGADEYRDPREFFARTFITGGLSQLLRDALIRLSGNGGDPVVELQTNFGGGKTHSMLALYHLFSDVTAADLAGMEPVLKEAGVRQPAPVRRAVLVGTDLSPGNPHKKKDGTEVRTLWGELAHQLGGKEGYALVAKDDREGTAPGSNALAELFRKYAPCLVLIDEWVAYVRQLHGKTDLPAGSFDNNLTFAQTLTEAAKKVENVLVVASIPSSQIEVGGEAGQFALAALKDTFIRVGSAWRPATAEEGYEIVRRRLFEPITETGLFAGRDAVIKAFSEMYRGQTQEFPHGCDEADYRRKIEAAYPIHPEVFSRLYNDWSTLDKFQRTRGVLRLMAAVIHSLWEREDKSLLILPASIPMDDQRVQHELTRYLEDPWVPIIEKDVDGPDSLPLSLDRKTPNLGRYSGCRRVARTIYLGSAPTSKTSHPGIDDRTIKLGCVQPGESPAVFGDALRRLSDQATHLYVDGTRYWYSLQPSVTRLAEDLAAQFDIETVWEELVNRLRKDKKRGDFEGVHVVPSSSADVPDEMEARMVILGPEYPHTLKAKDSPAMVQAKAILEKRGSSPRLYRNMLVFLAADKQRLAELEQGIRQYLAWGKIDREREERNLDAFQSNQAKVKTAQADTTVQDRIMETYFWGLCPSQPDPQGEIEWGEVRHQGKDSLAVRAGKKLVHDESLLTSMGPVRLRHELDKHLWKNTDHLGLKQLWNYFASYLYLPRLKNQDVLVGAVQDAVMQTAYDDTFAFAAGWDEIKSRYKGLKAGGGGKIVFDGQAVLVKSEVAKAQIAMESGSGRSPTGELSRVPPGQPTAGAPVQPGSVIDGHLTPPAARLLKRFYGSVELDPDRVGRDAGKIAEEVIQHLSTLAGASVRVVLEIEAQVEDGVPESTQRTVSENCKTLKFRSQGFEKA